jgi:hypothetical protein
MVAIDEAEITPLSDAWSSSRLPGDGMPNYQIHFLDVWGCVVRTVKLDCQGDDHARWLFEQQATGLIAMELWQGERLVERYESDLDGTTSAES